MSNEHDHGYHMDMPPSRTMLNGGMSNHMMMHLSFCWGKDAIVIFSRWPNQNLSMYVLALSFVFLLALATEVLSILPVVKLGMKPIVGRLTQATVYAFRMGLAYLIMLSVMSFNLGIFIVMMAGHALGFFIIKTRAIAIAKPVENMSSPNITSKV